MVFHCLSVPYSPTRKDISLCAFVQKVYKFCDEMVKRGHTVYHYGHEDSIVNCTEHINVMNYSNTTTYKTILSRSSDLYTEASVNLWRNTAAITSIIIGAQGAYTFSAGSTFTLYGIKAA